jgi:hypothetical protein
VTSPQAGDYAKALAEPRLMMIIQRSGVLDAPEDVARQLAKDLLAATIDDGGVVLKIRNGQIVLTFDVLPSNQEPLPSE